MNKSAGFAQTVGAGACADPLRSISRFWRMDCDRALFYSTCIKAKEYFMRFLTAERISNVLHVAILAMLAVASMDVAAHVAGHFV
jgi:hypothetical protein